MSNNLFFKFSFFATFILMIIVFSSNIERAAIAPLRREGSMPERIVLERVDKERIKKLIKENKLSDREALFYEKLQ